MNVEQITMSKAAARRKLVEYRHALKRRADAEYSSAEQAYKALAIGRPLVDLNAVFRDCAVDARGRPLVAIGRADERQVHLVMRNGQVVFDVRFAYGRRNGWATNVALPMRRAQSAAPNGYGLVPMVPPDVRRHHAMDRCHVLWEVERWADSAISSSPDRDPLLLRFLGGSLWSVLGAWDLTPVERAIMAGRAMS